MVAGLKCLRFMMPVSKMCWVFAFSFYMGIYRMFVLKFEIHFDFALLLKEPQKEKSYMEQPTFVH